LREQKACAERDCSRRSAMSVVSDIVVN